MVPNAFDEEGLMKPYHPMDDLPKEEEISEEFSLKFFKENMKDLTD